MSYVYSLLRQLLLAVCLLCWLPHIAAADRILTLGVLAVQPKPVAMARWQPLADYLTRSLDGYQVRLLALDQDEFQEALDQNRLDLVFSNPTHLIQLRQKNALTGAVATLVDLQQGQPVSTLGGVIIARADRNDLTGLASLQGKKVAAFSASGSLGSYPAPIYELKQAGVRSKQLQMVFTGTPQDRVVQAVLDDTVDAGFLRTGVLEQMAARGILDLQQLKVINRQNLPGYPFLLSTRLYPEWAFVALSHLPQGVARRLAAALLTLEPHSPAAQAAGIYGFTIPADYLQVENLLRELRLPPFETAPQFTLTDIWQRYRLQLLGFFFVVACIAGLAVLLMATNRRLATAHDALRNSEARWQFALDGAGHGVWDWDIAASRVLFSHQWKVMLGFADHEIGDSLEEWDRRLHPEDREQTYADIQQYLDGATSSYQNEHRVLCKDGSYKYSGPGHGGGLVC